jgi:hypothetical protein
MTTVSAEHGTAEHGTAEHGTAEHGTGSDPCPDSGAGMDARPRPDSAPGPGQGPVSGPDSGLDPGPFRRAEPEPSGVGAAGAPPPRGVPALPPVRAGGARMRLRRALRKRRRTVAAGLAFTAAALAAAMPVDATPAQAPARADRVAAATTPRQPAKPARNGDPAMVRAPVRIADAGVVELLRPGDRVDVLAAARVVACEAPVVTVPERDGDALGDGALVVLSVPRSTAAALAGASARSPLTVALV